METNIIIPTARNSSKAESELITPTNNMFNLPSSQTCNQQLYSLSRRPFTLPCERLHGLEPSYSPPKKHQNIVNSLVGLFWFYFFPTKNMCACIDPGNFPLQIFSFKVSLPNLSAASLRLQTSPGRCSARCPGWFRVDRRRPLGFLQSPPYWRGEALKIHTAEFGWIINWKWWNISITMIIVVIINHEISILNLFLSLLLPILSIWSILSCFIMLIVTVCVEPPKFNDIHMILNAFC